MLKITSASSQPSLLDGDALCLQCISGKDWKLALDCLDAESHQTMIQLAKAHKFSGKAGAQLQFSHRIGKRLFHVMLYMLPSETEGETDTTYESGGQAIRWANGVQAKRLVCCPPLGISAQKLCELITGLTLGNYSFTKLKQTTDKDSTTKLSQIILRSDSKECSSLIKRASSIAEGICSARDLVNEPANRLTPIELAKWAQTLAKKSKLKCKILDEKASEKAGMRLYLSVSKGSTANPPRFIHLSYQPTSKGKDKRIVYLIGKGLTFDSGGLSLKPSAGMMDMKLDMGGSAAVLGAMECLAQLKPNIEIHAIIAAAENMPDGKATRPGDVVVSKCGKSVEILNTDAEGRLTLADAISYAIEQGATEIVELSTLTGACMVALGQDIAGLYTRDDGLRTELLAAAARAGEGLWAMPMPKRMLKLLESPIADLKNIGGKYGGSITAALFLQEFAGKTSFAHIDMAGPAMTEEDRGHLVKGGRGYGVATLVEWLSPLK